MNHIPFTNTYVNLGEKFYQKTLPAPASEPVLIKYNDELAEELGLPASQLNSMDLAGIFSGNVIAEGAEPLAMAYAGHQFGHFNPQLGDGRAILLGELQSPSGERFDMQLKGSGRTLFSRDGDGRAALGPVLREYLLSEAMVKLGVPTTRALAAVTTGEEVARERLLPGGVITRIATSFVRVGTFQFFSARQDEAAVQQLADYVIERNYPASAEDDNPYASFLTAVVDRQAVLIAQWMQLGFIHGVMNTDNMSIAGETIDYGPCAFIDDFDHNRVFSSIDRDGRYAYGNQASIGLWNLTRLAECLLPLLAENEGTAVEIAQDILQSYAGRYRQAWLAGMQAKCGLSPSAETSEGDKALVDALLDTMAAGDADFTLTFYHLSQLSAVDTDNDHRLTRLFEGSGQIKDWLVSWRQRLSGQAHNDETRQQNMRAVNPVYIPRNHQIEAAIRAAEDQNDFSVFHQLHEVLQNPYDWQPGKEHYSLPPEPDQVVRQTFCGT